VKPVKINLFKLFTFILISAVIISISSAAIFISLYPKEKLIIVIINQAEKTLSRKITISGIDYSHLGIKLTDIKLYSPADEIIASAENADLGFSFFSLFQKDIKFNKIYIKSLKINTAFKNDGSSEIVDLISDMRRNSNSDSASFKIDIIEIKNASLSFINLPKSYKPLEGRYILDGIFNLTDIKNIKGTNIKLLLPGNRGELRSELNIIQDSEKFEIKGDVDIIRAYLPWVYKLGDDVNQPYNMVKGKISDLYINAKIVRGHVIANSTLLNSNKIVYADGFCSVDIKKDILNLYNITGKIDTSSFFINNIIYNIQTEKIEFSLTKIDAELSDAALLVKQIPLKIFGRAKGNVSLKNGIFNSELKIKDTGYDSAQKTLSGINSDVYIKNNTFKMENINAFISGNSVNLSIASTDLNLNKMFIFINSEYFILTDSILPGDKGKTEFPIEFTGKINVAKLIYDDIIFSDASLSYSAKKNEINVENFSTRSLGGEINGKGSILFIESRPKVNVSCELTGIKVQDIVSYSDNFKNRFFGIAEGRANINFSPGKNFTDTVYGKFDFTIKNGKVADTGIQNGLGIWLSELKYKLKDLEFNKISGNINIAGKNFIINSFIFNADDIRVKLNGAFDKKFFAEKNVDIELSFTKNFIQDLPGPAITLMGLDRYFTGGWYIIPFAAKGKITDGANIKRLK
jgi:hypothetical protein